MATEQLTPFGSALAGALGGVFANAVVYPLDTVKTRLQALPHEAEDELPSPSDSSSRRSKRSLRQLRQLPAHLLQRLRRWRMMAMLLRIIKTEGIGGTFKGFSANMINTFSQQFAYFFFHTLLRTTTQRRLQARSQVPVASLSTSIELLLGAGAGALAQIFTIPVAVIATRQQLWSPPPSSSSAESAKHVRSPGLIEVAQEIIAEGGPTALWTGLKPGLVLTVNPAITYGVFERLKSWSLSSRPREGGKLSVAEAFWLGVGSKTLATVVTYPYIFAKVRLQAMHPSSETSTRTTGDINPGEVEKGISYADVASQTPADNSVTVDKASVDPAPTPVAIPQITKRRRKVGALGILAHVYRKQGLKGWYQGLNAQILKAVLCQGILFVSKDQFEVYALVILALFSRLRARLAGP